MNTDKPIDVEATPSQALAVRDTGGAVGYALSLEELHRNLEYVRDVMRKEMREGQDYGKIPGTGEKPTLLQPGAQKLLLTFNLTEKVKKEVLREYPNYHREYEFILTVCAANGKEWDGVGTCSTLEAKYRYRKAERKCPTCGKHTIIAGREEYGGGWLCYKKKGGCGAKFEFSDQAIQSQQVGRVEHDNPPDYWNTVRKMAYKRALVHASINATNTSDLWTQDMEETPVDDSEASFESQAPANKPAPSKAQGKTSPDKPTTITPHPPQQNASEGKSERKVATETTKKWALGELDAFGGARDLITEFFQKVDALLPTESVEELPLEYVPTSKAELASLKTAITEFGNGGEAHLPYKHDLVLPEKKPIEVPCDPDAGKQEEAERAIDPEWEIVTGKVAKVSYKSGTKKNGEQWELFGIKIGDDWLNTFSSRIGHFAQAAEKSGDEVTVYYSEGEKGLNAEEIE